MGNPRSKRSVESEGPGKTGTSPFRPDPDRRCPRSSSSTRRAWASTKKSNGACSHRHSCRDFSKIASMLTNVHASIDAVYRSDWGRIVATLIRLTGDFDLAEEAAQEA